MTPVPAAGAINMLHADIMLGLVPVELPLQQPVCPEALVGGRDGTGHCVAGGDLESWPHNITMRRIPPLARTSFIIAFQTPSTHPYSPYQMHPHLMKPSVVPRIPTAFSFHSAPHVKYCLSNGIFGVKQTLESLIYH